MYFYTTSTLLYSIGKTEPPDVSVPGCPYWPGFVSGFFPTEPGLECFRVQNVGR
jgi:hypothetical protein